MNGGSQTLELMQYNSIDKRVGARYGVFEQPCDDYVQVITESSNDSIPNPHHLESYAWELRVYNVGVQSNYFQSN
jgi:hypothetical protein